VEAVVQGAQATLAQDQQEQSNGQVPGSD
jgi:hypothetical protein